MKKLILYTAFVFFSVSGYAQKESAVWFFGGTGLDFNCNPPKPLSANNSFYPQEGSSSISDSAGNLLFYTDGYSVFDNTHQLMPNGFDIGADIYCSGSSTQGALIVKQPLQDSLYYIFTTDCAENKLANGFCYSIVNMKLNGGKGDIIIKKQQLLTKTCEKLAATRHSNGIDVWILTHEWGNNTFCSFLLNSSGLITSPIYSNCGRVQLPDDMTDNYPSQPYPECASKGHLKFSTQGNKVVVLSTSDCHPFQAYPEIFSFNKTNGTLTFDYNINTQDSIIYYAGSFSPNGNVLYLSSAWYGNYLHQYDITSNDSVTIAASRNVIYVDPSFQNIPCGLQVGSDGKLYNVSRPVGLNVIDNPNLLGAACNFQLNAILTHDDSCGSYVEYGLPNNDESIYSASFVGSSCSSISIADFAYIDSCFNSPISFYDSSVFYPELINKWHWNFGDPASGTMNQSTQRNPQHTYSTAGIYTVKLIVSTDTIYYCKSDTVIKTIPIYNCINGINGLNYYDNFPVLFPNPSSGLVKLKLPQKQSATSITINDALGQRVFSTSNLNETIDLTFLEGGIYNVMIKNSSAQYSTKLIIQK